jgi:diadenosine tetraphosphate (Ap4A) HIT family hydrolase
MIVLNREETDVTRLSEAEWLDLRRCLRRVTAALDSLFQPDTYNFAFLMNEDRWVHLHVVPRYESPHEWAGERFEDPHFGSLFGTERRLPEADALLRLSRAVAAALPLTRTRANVGPGGARAIKM